MADLFVTFASTRSVLSHRGKDKALPIGKGSGTVTEALLITSTVQTTSTVADADRRVVYLRADDACFVQVGSAPSPASMTSGTSNQGIDVWPMASGDRLELELDPGEKVGVIQV